MVPGGEIGHPLPLPFGRRVDLPERGTIFVREIAGPRDAPTVVLLHGWFGSAGLSWGRTFPALAGHRVIAPDLRGHGRGIRSRKKFSFTDNAADVAVLLDHLKVSDAIVVGYSMGGPIAQLLWRDRPDLVGGLVLAATGSAFARPHERFLMFGALGPATVAARANPLRIPVPSTVSRLLAHPAIARRPTSMPLWAQAELRRHSPRMLTEALLAISTFDSSRWIGEVDVPTTIVITTADNAVHPTIQHDLAATVGHATITTVRGGHLSCLDESFGPRLVEIIDDIDRRRRDSTEVATGCR